MNKKKLFYICIRFARFEVIVFMEICFMEIKVRSGYLEQVRLDV